MPISQPQSVLPIGIYNDDLREWAGDQLSWSEMKAISHADDWSSEDEDFDSFWGEQVPVEDPFDRYTDADEYDWKGRW